MNNNPTKIIEVCGHHNEVDGRCVDCGENMPKYLVILVIGLVVGIFIGYTLTLVPGNCIINQPTIFITKYLVCRNETIVGGFTFRVATQLNAEPDVYCVVNETLTQSAIESNYPYTIYTCVKEVCEEYAKK